MLARLGRSARSLGPVVNRPPSKPPARDLRQHRRDEAARREGPYVNAERLRLWVAALVSTAVIAMITMGAPRAQSPSAIDRVYTLAQARRGQALFDQNCSSCHSSESGAATSLTGDDFVARWRGSTVGDLFENIRTSMPENAPGTLSLRQTADVVAYLLHVNRFPAGDADLGADAAILKQMRMTQPQTTGPPEDSSRPSHEHSHQR